MINCTKARVVHANYMDAHPSTYFYTYRFLEGRLNQLVVANSTSGLLSFNIPNDCQLKNSYHLLVTPERLLGMDPELDNWNAVQQTTPSDHRYLGKWENLFVKAEHQPDFLSWEALLWIGKDFGNHSDVLTTSVEALVAKEAYMHSEGLPYNVA
jgi:hypothetical protein